MKKRLKGLISLLLAVLMVAQIPVIPVLAVSSYTIYCFDPTNSDVQVGDGFDYDDQSGTEVVIDAAMGNDNGGIGGYYFYEIINGSENNLKSGNNVTAEQAARVSVPSTYTRYVFEGVQDKNGVQTAVFRGLKQVEFHCEADISVVFNQGEDVKAYDGDGFTNPLPIGITDVMLHEGTLVKLSAPAETNEGEPFSHWRVSVEGEGLDWSEVCNQPVVTREPIVKIPNVIANKHSVVFKPIYGNTAYNSMMISVTKSGGLITYEHEDGRTGSDGGDFGRGSSLTVPLGADVTISLSTFNGENMYWVPVDKKMQMPEFLEGDVILADVISNNSSSSFSFKSTPGEYEFSVQENMPNTVYRMSGADFSYETHLYISNDESKNLAWKKSLFTAPEGMGLYGWSDGGTAVYKVTGDELLPFRDGGDYYYLEPVSGANKTITAVYAPLFECVDMASWNALYAGATYTPESNGILLNSSDAQQIIMTFMGDASDVVIVGGRGSSENFKMPWAPEGKYWRMGPMRLDEQSGIYYIDMHSVYETIYTMEELREQQGTLALTGLAGFSALAGEKPVVISWGGEDVDPSNQDYSSEEYNDNDYFTVCPPRYLEEDQDDIWYLSHIGIGENNDGIESDVLYVNRAGAKITANGVSEYTPDRRIAGMAGRYTYAGDVITLVPEETPGSAELLGFLINEEEYLLEDIDSGDIALTYGDAEGYYNFEISNAYTDMKTIPNISIEPLYAYRVTMDGYPNQVVKPGDIYYLTKPVDTETSKFKEFRQADDFMDCEILVDDQGVYSFVMPNHPVAFETIMTEYYPVVVDGEKLGYFAAGETVNVIYPAENEELRYAGYMEIQADGTQAAFEMTRVNETKLSFVMPERSVTLACSYTRYYSVTVDGQSLGYFKAGENVTLTPVSTPTKKFVAWQAPEGIAVTDNSFVMPAANVTITASYDVYSDTFVVGTAVKMAVGVPYKFEAGKKYKVNGDSTVYMGGQTFFVSASGEFTISEN